MPSLYETTAIVGDVSSSNFTTLYNSSGLSAPNTGGGAVGGNLNVAGNLTVQGSSLLQGAVTIGSTLSLPNYTFPTPDGTTDQVITTDGSGNLYWASVTTLPGASYTIQADTATGGANLSLVSSLATDSVKFAGGTNITVTRTDANTITISTVADNIPDGTAQGQVLYWDGSAWTADNTITSLATANRFITEFKNTNKALTGALVVRRNYAGTAYANNDEVDIIFQVDSDSQTPTAVGTIGYNYSNSNPALSSVVSTDNFATSTEIAKVNLTNVEFNGTNLYLNKNHTGAPSSNASINVERGSSTDASLTWNETADQWQFTNDLFVSGNYGQNGQSITINADNTAADSFLYMKGNTRHLKYDNTDEAFQFTGGDIRTNFNYLLLDTDGVFNDAGVYFRSTGTTKSLLWNSLASPSPQFEFNDNLAVAGDLRVTGDIYVSGYQIDINTPVKGDVLYFDGTKFVNENVIAFDSAAARTRFQYNISTNSGGINAAATMIKNTGASAYTNGDGSGILIGVGSNSQANNTFAGLSAAYSTTNNHEVRLRTSTDSFATNDVSILAVNNDDLKVKAAEFVLNALGTGSAAVDAQITVERGTSGTDSYLKWAEANGRWEFGQSVYSANNIAAAGNVAVNRDASNANAVVLFYKPTTGTESLQWNKDNNRFELTTDLYVPQASIGVIDINRTTGQIDTNSGSNLTLDSDGGTVFINDNLNVDSGVLYVDATNNRVGVNTVSPSVDLQVGGTIFGNTIIAVNGDLGTNGNNIYFNYDDGPAADCSLIVKRPSAGDPAITWNETTDRWTTTVDGTTYLNIPNQNLDTNSDVTFASVTVDGGHTVIDTTTTTTTSTTQTAITSTSNATTRSSKFQIQVTDNVTGNIHVLEAMMFFQGTTAYLTTYAEMYNSTSLATFAADVSAGNTRLLATPATANNTTFKVTRISVAL